MDDINNNSLDDQEISQVTALLNKLKPGYLPFDIFSQVARIAALPIVEIMPLRKKNGKIEILLTRRRENDEYWPGLWHVPGTVVRADDESLDRAFDRVLKGELKNLDATSPTLFQSALRKSERGREAAQLFWVGVRGEPPVGKFFAVDDLPDDIIKSQIEFINSAVEASRL